MFRLFLGGMCLLGFHVPALMAADEPLGPDAKRLADVRRKAITYLRTAQRDDGGWTAPNATGITALVAQALLDSGVAPTDPALTKALDLLAGLLQPDGRISAADSRIPGYETAIALTTLQAANASGKYDKAIAAGENFLRGLQFDESKKTEPGDASYGGIGYGPSGGRPDLSNTVFFLEALEATGANSDDPAVKKALIFLSRCQNLESEFNPGKNTVNDGGFFYTPAAGGNSPSGNTPEGGLRSYGSMTYAGLKSMVYAGLTPDDQRVAAALAWIRKHYTVSENPGMGQNGLFYYYFLFAKSLGTLKLDQVEDASQAKHDWRKELAEHLFAQQQANGSWVNSKSSRWMEGDPNLVTAYALTALKSCEPPTKE